MFRSTSLISLFFLVLPLSTFAQLRIGNIFVHNPDPVYILSADGKTLGTHEIAENEQRWCGFINLENFTWYPQGSVSIKKTFLTPDLKSAYSGEMNPNGFKGNNEWQAYDKYMSWYYPNNVSMQRNQWPDNNFIIAARTDGKILTAGDIKFKKEKQQVVPVATINDLNVTDPLTGRVISNVRKGKVMTVPYDWWNTKGPLLINDNNLLVWNDISWTLWYSMKLEEGEPITFHVPDAVDVFSGKFAMGVNTVSRSDGAVKHRKFIVDMETGTVVYDNTIETKAAFGYWCAAGTLNSFYTLNGFTSELSKEIWDGEKFTVTKSVKLDISEVSSSGHWGQTDESGYQLIVSDATNQVLMLPKAIATGNYLVSNVLLAWKLNDGQLTYKNPDFIKPFQSYLDKQAQIR